ncbi:MAG: hypothetical protein AB8B80_08045 [Marinicellaceae bacterium]
MKTFLIIFLIMFGGSIKAQVEYSYLWAHQYPALADPQINCCFNFVGDAEDDDLNGTILLQLESLLSFDAQESIDNQIINNELARVWRWDSLPSGDGLVQMSILEAEVGTTNLGLTGRMNGFTEVYVNPVPLSVFSGNITNGELVMTSESALGVFYNSVISSSEVSELQASVEIPLNQARITGQLEINESGCNGVCSGTLKSVDPAILGAIEVSGLIYVGDELNATNEILSSCACAGIDSSIDLLSFNEDGSSLQVMCQYNSGELTPENCGSDYAYCQNVDQQCSFAALNANQYDVDTNNNGVLDSKSVGGLMGLAGAIYIGLTDLIFKNSFDF